MHKEILTDAQNKLLPLIEEFSKDFGLVGGTAIALELGHRRSIDFDLFSNKEFENLEIRRKIAKRKKIERVFIDTAGEYTILIKKVKITFFYYPFAINFNKKINRLEMADLPTLAALKAFALGRRAKWKDYVDLYFIMKDYYSIKEIIKKAKQIFGNEFNEKMFRAQLSYFKDIDYTEEIIYMKGFEMADKIIRKGLAEFALE